MKAYGFDTLRSETPSLPISLAMASFQRPLWKVVREGVFASVARLSDGSEDLAGKSLHVVLDHPE